MGDGKVVSNRLPATYTWQSSKWHLAANGGVGCRRVQSLVYPHELCSLAMVAPTRCQGWLVFLKTPPRSIHKLIVSVHNLIIG